MTPERRRILDICLIVAAVAVLFVALSCQGCGVVRERPESPEEKVERQYGRDQAERGLRRMLNGNDE